MFDEAPRWAGLLSAGEWTELAIHMLEGGQLDDRGDHLVLRTPDNPTYMWGNSLQLLPGAAVTAADDVAGWLDRFRAEFPDAKHWAFGLPGAPSEAWLATEGEPDELFSLTTYSALLMNAS